MLVRITGVVEKIIMQDGIGKETRKPWEKKTYVIRDNTFRKEEYNRIVHVSEMGKLDPNKSLPEFTYNSYYAEGETVDMACFLETNEKGFTNVNYWKPFEDTEQKPEPNNVVRPEEQQPEPVYVPAEEREDKDELPF